MSFDYSRKNKRWRLLRSQTLKDAGYLCQHFRRYGKRVEATHVHHIWPVEDWPEYAYQQWNLIALSLEAHNLMHDRITGKLSPLGEALRRRTVPPGPKF